MSTGILAGVLADRVIPDPRRGHPVALFGTWAAWLERRCYRDSRAAGCVHLVLSVALPVAVTVIASRHAPRLTNTVCLWAALGGTMLERTGTRMADALECGDTTTARELVPWLCSRDPALLDGGDMARAAVESLAENTSDAAIAPLVWAAIGGAPAVVAHRAVNTLDAMVGYRNDRYRNFGWAAARMDDVLAWLPARTTALVHTGLAAAAGRGTDAVRAWREDAPSHPSPNAGIVEATAAAALGVRLGGATAYAHGVENRPVLGTGRPPDVAAIRDAVRLSRRTQAIVTVVTAAATVLLRGGRTRTGG
ncbi:cobalamin biosynthesis protein [Corynebacterium sp. CCM 9185]|uniref:Cobalamin biosynthesis protein CobD n=1 Tax=Corynebacterium marambiense TaxID=2765364 RepID=A0ABS0VZ87_9CORY|nr:cobalamin biosynthesis protein [Corynebacterium marambiense]MBI9000950.1 cobalamin biosynthesis protein [Corynebacterium marambiense]MCK7662779.1 cobalamin biosynthesis protein [Corynebacterium marambiense]MCX7542388.1 cobalamin biosynthesis protein [Corynebacterium marambiense]